MISFQIGTSQQAFAHYIREAIRQWHCQRRWLPGRYKIKTNSLKSRTFTEIFLQSWEKNDDPAEQEGKGVAIKSCTQFFTWLKEVGEIFDAICHICWVLSQQISRKHCAIDQILIICTFRRRRRKISWLWLFWWYLQEIFCKNIFAREVESRFRLLLFHTAALPPPCWHDNRRILSNVGSIKVIKVKLKKF